MIKIIAFYNYTLQIQCQNAANNNGEPSNCFMFDHLQKLADSIIQIGNKVIRIFNTNT
jgi:hypothetical protein